MIQRKTPLKPSTVPLRRTAIKRTKPVARKKPRVRTTKAILRDCDAIWRHHIKRESLCFLRAAGLGECAGNFEAAHLIARSQSARIKYHPENGICLCTRHHMIFDNKIQGTMHKRALDYVHTQLPGRYEMLKGLAMEKLPLNRVWWEEWLEYLKTI